MTYQFDKGKRVAVDSTPPSSKSSSNAEGTPNKSTTSEAWEHFIQLSSDPLHPRSKCRYCGKEYKCGFHKGTSNLLGHIRERCLKYPGRARVDKKQKTLSYKPVKIGEPCSLVSTTYNVEACREAIAKFVIKDEMSFRVVEGEGFKVPSRTTIARDILQLYKKTKKDLTDFFVSSHQRVCLTTDTWTSAQNLCYMCLTAHFIDDNWTLHKKILNFCQVADHKGETIGRQIETCLLDWGIERVFTVTVDNASSNDGVVFYLSKVVNNWNSAILGGQNMHLRCSAHILNLIVAEGLKEYHQSISKIRNVFKAYAEREKISSNKLLCLDVVTRWNSTFFMLEAAEKYEKVFDRLELHDAQYIREFCLNEPKTCPSSIDWEYARYFIKFLKVFHDATLTFSGSLYVTSNNFLRQLCLIHTQLQAWRDSKDLFLKIMAENMKKKYDKYWGNYETINPYLFVSILLEPRHKERFLRYCFVVLFGEFKANELVVKVRNNLHSLYEEYKLLYGDDVEVMDAVNDEKDLEVDTEVDARQMFDLGYMGILKDNIFVECKTEVDLYLLESCENLENESFDVLDWWKINSSKYPILSYVARDILAMPVSTVASESAFSTGGRVLDPHRCSLSTRTVEALICTQNWLRSTPINFDEAIDEIEHIETEILGADKNIFDEA
ncbi:BED-type domain-containing protein [Citrus sinensis]|uniref:BED-type domain-containing protein n=1 Tax=Citrus sinensis TaxID=2711 RepID=A0ACB8JUZ5_CITSI|nr:BED-type domain-containing protein [Citrus sinensis]